MTELRIADDFALPLESVTQAIAILAKRRAGKSYTARKLVEQLHHTGQQVVIVDPKGDWWGVRTSADGQRAGLPILRLGGEHGDITITSSAGEALARFVVEERASILLDLSDFRKHEIANFMAHFLETLYRLKAREQYRTPLMLMVDEADAIAPQKAQPGEQRMLGAAEDIVRRGGQRGIGCAMVTQRPAVLNKNVLTQAQIIVALRTIAPQDLVAVNDWIDVHGSPEQRRELMASLPSLPVGTAWFWSPGWPTDAGIFRQVRVGSIETYDSGATPRPGEYREPPRALAEVDLSALREKLGAMIETAATEDPAALRRRIADLEQQLRAKPVAAQKVERVVERVEVPIVTAEQLRRLSDVADGLSAAAMRVIDAAGEVRAALVQARSLSPAASLTPFALPPTAKPAANVPMGIQLSAPGVATATKLGKAERLILTALAQYPAGRSHTQVAILTGYSGDGGGFRNALGALRSRGLVAGSRDRLQATWEGLEALGTWEPLPTGRALLEHWLGQLGKAERLILRALTDAYPRSLTTLEVSAASGYEASGGGFRNALGKLRTLELIEGRGEVRASDALFQEAGHS